MNWKVKKKWFIQIKEAVNIIKANKPSKIIIKIRPRSFRTSRASTQSILTTIKHLIRFLSAKCSGQRTVLYQFLPSSKEWRALSKQYSHYKRTSKPSLGPKRNPTSHGRSRKSCRQSIKVVWGRTVRGQYRHFRVSTDLHISSHQHCCSNSHRLRPFAISNFKTKITT